jgi:hypothetical protein
VVQQRSGPVDGTDAGGGVRVSDPSDRFEREAVATADRVMSGPNAVTQRCADGSAHEEAVQRTAVPTAVPDEEEQAPAQTYVQREEDEEPEQA